MLEFAPVDVDPPVATSPFMKKPIPAARDTETGASSSAAKTTIDGIEEKHTIFFTV
jgi:hypothetical protein